MGSASSSTPDQLHDLDQDLITLCLNFFITENDETKLEYLLSSFHVPGTTLTTLPELFSLNNPFLSSYFSSDAFHTLVIEFSQYLYEEAILMIPILQKRRLRDHVPWARLSYSKWQRKNLNSLESDNQASVYSPIHTILAQIWVALEDTVGLDKRRWV